MATGSPSLFGHDLFGDPIARPSRGKIADDFVCPPFTVLSSREGWWQERKRAWIARGIKSEIGRGDDSTPYTDSEGYVSSSGNNGKAFRIHQTKPTQTNDPGGVGGEVSQSGTSIFDPVLCELAYRWFSPPGGMVLDPFAGGSVRGVVAGMLGRRYHGIELRPEQVAANESQADAIAPDPRPTWVAGDSAALLAVAPIADMVFSCPPYFDLEKYSDDPRDLSSMPWPAFRAAYRGIIAASAGRLRPDRFACFVVGDVRDKAGNYRNLPGETIAAFRDAGMELYNEAILVTPVGSLPIRVTAQFNNSRKLGKTHQNVLVFVKGDPKRAASIMPMAPGTEAAS